MNTKLNICLIVSILLLTSSVLFFANNQEEIASKYDGEIYLRTSEKMNVMGSICLLIGGVSLVGYFIQRHEWENCKHSSMLVKTNLDLDFTAEDFYRSEDVVKLIVKQLKKPLDKV